MATKKKGRCVWCARTTTELQPANPALGPGAEECVNANECIDVYQKLIDKLIGPEQGAQS